MDRPSDTRPKRRLIIVLGFECYLAVTFLVFLFGPLDFSKPHFTTVIILVAAYQSALFAGFVLAERYIPVRAGLHIPGSRGRGVADVVPLATVGLSLSLFFSYSSLASFAQTWNPFKLTDTVSRSLVNPGHAYVANLASEQAGTWITKVATLAAPLTFAAFVLGLYYFMRLTPTIRALVIASGVFELLTAAIRGMNFGVFKVTIVVLTVGLLHLLNKTARRRLSRRRLVAGAGVLVAVVSAFVGYFVITTGDRLSGHAQRAVIAGVPIDYSSPLVSGLPDSLKSDAVLFSLYMSQGYHGLSLVSGYDFTSTYGFGNSVFVMNNLDRTFGWDLFPRTYVHKMDPVWSESENWHTAYTWFANDVGLWGVVVVMLGMGAAISVVLRGAERGEVLAIALLPLMMMMLIFLPANNVVMSNPLTAMPLGILGLAYGLLVARHNSWGSGLIRVIRVPVARVLEGGSAHLSGVSEPEPPRKRP